MKLWDYEDKRVRITAKDGQIFEGLVDFYTSELDNPDGIATLSLIQEDKEGVLIEFEEKEINKIELLDAIESKVFSA